MTNLLFFLKKIIANLLLPPTLLILLGLIGMLLLRRAPRIARVFLWTGLLCWLLLSLPVVERVLMRSLATPALTEQQAQSTQAIMILGGGITRATPEYGDTLGRFSLERVRYGAALARRYHLPILVTGGQVYGGRSEGEVMAQVLHDEFGITVRWIETRSRDTVDNLALAAPLFQPDRIQSVLLVTHDFHMQRALAACKATTLTCVAAPVTSDSPFSDNWLEELPNQGSLFQSGLALHELLGLFAQRFH